MLEHRPNGFDGRGSIQLTYRRVRGSEPLRGCIGSIAPRRQKTAEREDRAGRSRTIRGMCCFSAPTKVFGTSIFARFTKPGVQALVYQMRFEAKEPTAMILPLPVARTQPGDGGRSSAREDAVRWKNLEAYPSFFEDLTAGFPAPEPSFTLSRSKGERSAALAVAPLTVHEVGAFVASFVPSVDDFARLDPRFAISKDVWAKIPAYADYGFAVFQLKSLSGSPHPIAFEFDTRTPGTLFYPTVHIHDGTVHAEDVFDHVLYVQERDLDTRAGSYDGPEAVDRTTGFVRSKEQVARFAQHAKSAGLLDGDLLVHKHTMRGLLPNRDTTFDLRAIAARTAAGCSRCSTFPEGGAFAGIDGSWMPATALASLAWIVRRRETRRRERG